MWLALAILVSVPGQSENTAEQLMQHLEMKLSQSKHDRRRL